MHKSRVFFSSNTSTVARTSILSITKVSTCINVEKCLGLPMLVGRNKYCTFETLKNRVWGQIRYWKNIFLSQFRKEVLLKAAIEAILTCSMILFALSRKMCQEIASSMFKFWWSSMKKESGIHWRKWKNLGDPKSQGILVLWTKKLLTRLC